MPESSQSPAPRKPVVGLQIKLPCNSRDAFALAMVTSCRGALSSSVRAHPGRLGTVIRFDLRLADGASVLRGFGVVKSVVAPGGTPDRPGMALQLRGLEQGSLEVLKELGITTSVPALRAAPAAATRPPEPEKTVLTPPSPAPAGDRDAPVDMPGAQTAESGLQFDRAEQTTPDPPYRSLVA